MKIVLILLFLFLIYILLTYVIFVLVFRRFDGFLLNKLHKVVYKSSAPYKDKINETTSWLNNKINKKQVENIYIKSYDNLKLHGIFIKNKKQKGIFMVVHGYRSNALLNLFVSYNKYYEKGYSILLMNQRCSLDSEGKYITFGIKERKDVLSFVEFLNDKYPNTDIVIAGISMGASSVLMSIPYLENNMNIKLLIVDSAYISIKDEFKYYIRKTFHLSGKVLIMFINVWCKLFAHFDINETNTLDSMEKSTIPILFIHNQKDNIIPNENSIINYEHYNGKKDLLIINGSGHGLGYLVDSDNYLKKVYEMLNC